MKELIHPLDPYQMNWIEGVQEWGNIKQLPQELEVRAETEFQDEVIHQRFIFTNTSSKYLFTARDSIGIYTPFNDNYNIAELCLHNRCHTHIFCGGDVSYVMALRMNGEGPHLGLVLTEGSLCSYSIERDLKQTSNDRGDFILHPSPVEVLAPGASFTIGWTLFWHHGKEDFYRQLPVLNKRHIDVKANHYTLFQSESLEMTITPAFPFTAADVMITCRDEAVPFTIHSNEIKITANCDTIGERIYQISVCGVKTQCRVLIQPDIETLTARRCRFIARHQQINNSNAFLDGAYLVYDNEDERIHNDPAFLDHSSAAERVGMGILMARYLQSHPDKELEESLQHYISFIDRAIADRQTGIVKHEYNQEYPRLYNYPWTAQFYLSVYDLWHNKEDLRAAYNIIMAYYRRGGSSFYAFEHPINELLDSLKAAGWAEEYRTAMGWFREHGDNILKNGLNYPPHEVRYEQSIVAPGAEILLKVYKATGDSKFLEGAKQQIMALDLFNGLQPDWHLYEVAIRHWDGYWFGKRKLYGDTFPHYWSGLTADIFNTYGEITGDPAWKKRAEDAYRGVLGLILPDGRASCAYLFPASCNGIKGEFFDPYANDQDWALVFYLRQLLKKS